LINFLRSTIFTPLLKYHDKDCLQVNFCDFAYKCRTYTRTSVKSVPNGQKPCATNALRTNRAGLLKIPQNSLATAVA